MANSIHSLPGFDVFDALERFGGRDELFQKYLGLMIKEFHQRLPLVRFSLNAGEPEAARLALHTLTGTASALSATHLVALCKQGEHLCKQGASAEALEILSSIEATLETLRPWV